MIQGHWNWYQSKACMRFVTMYIRRCYWSKTVFFSPFLPTRISFWNPHMGLPCELWYEIWCLKKQSPWTTPKISTILQSLDLTRYQHVTDRQTDRPIAHSWVMHMHSKNVLHHWSTVQRKSAERQYLLGDDSATHNTTSTVFWRQIHTQIWTLHRHTYHDQLFLNMYQHF